METEDRTELRAGVAQADITDYDAGPVNDALYAKALVLTQGGSNLVVITVDAVALAEIGPVRGDYLANVRTALAGDLGIQPECVLINASHCHGIVCGDADQRTIKAVKDAYGTMVPVRAGSGLGHENRIMENRRLHLRDGKVADVRHAYSLPANSEVLGSGPIDPDIGVLRLDKEDGQTLAALYSVACHPIKGVPSGGNTADIVGFASKAIETALGPGTIALFLQGCAGDINPAFYKDVDHPRDAEILGNKLGLSALQALMGVQCHENTKLKVIHESLELPRANLAPRIAALQGERDRLLHALQGTSLNLQTFLPLVVKYSLDPEFPSCAAHRYLHDRAAGRDDLDRLDALNRQHMSDYIANIHTMEELTRVQTNLDLLTMHQADYVATVGSPIDVEILGVRIGDFALVTFPGELSVQIGLNLKAESQHGVTCVAGCTNGYIYYAPTTEQLRNPGSAQEDCDCILAPEWQPLFEQTAKAILQRL